MEESGDPNLIRLAKQMKETGKRGQEKEKINNNTNFSRS